MVEVAWLRLEFWALVLSSLALPITIGVHLLRARDISRWVLLSYAIGLLVLAGVDILLLKALAELARESLNPVDDAVFRSEYSVALYMLPLIAAGVGVNLLSFVITQHLRITP